VTTRLPRPDYFNHPVVAPYAHLVNDRTRIEAMDLFAPLFQRGWGDWLRIGQAAFEARIDGPGDETLMTLQREGVVLLKMDGAMKARIRKLVSSKVDAIEANLAACDGKPAFPDMHARLVKADWEEVYDLITRALADLHVFEVASAYVKKPLRIRQLHVQLNNEHETRLRYGVIDADGLPARKSDYWHIDGEIWPNFKALLYLDDVTLEQGPMRYIPGTHRNLDAFETVARKVNDNLKLSWPHFLSLPDALRVHALFGPFMTGEEPEAKALLDREVACCDEGKDLLLFDNNGVHRGGFVRQGSRRIMQILFEPAVSKRQSRPRISAAFWSLIACWGRTCKDSLRRQK